jgi:hypothetical protein
MSIPGPKVMPLATVSTVSTVASVRCAALIDRPEQRLDVLGVMSSAVYLATRGTPSEVVAVLAQDAVRHPNALVLPMRTSDRPFVGVDTTGPATIGDGRLVLGGRDHADGAGLVLRVGRWYDPVPRIAPPDHSMLPPVADLIEAAASRSADDLPDTGRSAARAALSSLGRALVDDASGAERPEDERPEDAAEAMIGLGPGLTPSGDDMLAGLLATLVHLPPDRAVAARLVAVRRRVRERASGRTTLLSACLLEAALDGAVAAPFALLLRTIAEVLHGPDGGHVGRSVALRDAVDAVLSIGSTSGADLLLGTAVALRVTASVDALVEGSR